MDYKWKSSEIMLIDSTILIRDLQELQDRFNNHKESMMIAVFGDHHVDEHYAEWLENPNIVDFFVSLNSYDQRRLLMYIKSEDF